MLGSVYRPLLTLLRNRLPPRPAAGVLTTREPAAASLEQSPPESGARLAICLKILKLDNAWRTHMMRVGVIEYTVDEAFLSGMRNIVRDRDQEEE